MANSPERSLAGRRRKPRYWLALAFVAAGAAYGVYEINRFGILQGNTWGIDINTKTARYVYGRWPRTWGEVDRAVRAYEDQGAGMEHAYSSVTFETVGDDCLVRSSGRNMLGFPTTRTERLTWSPGDERSWSQGERHSEAAVNIFQALRPVWMKHRRLDASRQYWQPYLNWPDAQVANVRLAPGLEGHRLEQLPPQAVCLIVDFTDGAARRVKADGAVAPFPPPVVR